MDEPPTPKEIGRNNLFPFQLLCRSQLAEVLALPDDQACELFIGGAVRRDLGRLFLVLGDMGRIIVPLSVFSPSGVAQPDFGSFKIDDYGTTLRFGNYEASADFAICSASTDTEKVQ